MATLIVLAGLPASGKSTIARAIAERTGAMWLRVDSMDQALKEAGTAPSDLMDWTYRAAQAVAVDNLRLGRDVVADCVNDWQLARDGWESAATRAGAELRWLEVVCSDPVEHQQRVEERKTDIPGLVLPTWAAVRNREYHAWNRERLVLDTAGHTPATSIDEALTLLRGAK